MAENEEKNCVYMHDLWMEKREKNLITFSFETGRK